MTAEDGNNNPLGKIDGVVSSTALGDEGLHCGEECDLAEPSKVAEDAEFDMYFEVISKSDITVGEEKNHLVSLIKKRRKFLVKRLVLQMTGLGMGKSKVFKSLSAQYLKIKEDKARNLEEQGGSGVAQED